MELSPIALFAYNRPEHLNAALKALAANPLAAESDLIIFSDGPKDAGSARSVAEVRDVAKSATGFGSVQVIERPSNAGLVASITGGVRDLLETHGRIIVLEDDLITAPGFLAYMNKALQTYAQHDQVMQVTGYMYPIDPPSEACFLPTISCWGWGTWKRAWDAYDADASASKLVDSDAMLRKKFDLDGAYDYSGLLKRHLRGEISSWGVVWYLSVFARGGLVLHPPRSLVSNEGFDGSGSHAARQGREDDLGHVALDQSGKEIAYPQYVRVDEQAFDRVKRSLRRSHRGWRNLARRFL